MKTLTLSKAQFATFLLVLEHAERLLRGEDNDQPENWLSYNMCNTRTDLTGYRLIHPLAGMGLLDIASDVHYNPVVRLQRPDRLVVVCADVPTAYPAQVTRLSQGRSETVTVADEYADAQQLREWEADAERQGFPVVYMPLAIVERYKNALQAGFGMDDPAQALTDASMYRW